MGRLAVRVEGRVQGVGFRHFVRERARELGLRGWVWNSPDGAVELAAEGPDGAVEALRAAVERGPVGARVERLAPLAGAEAGGRTDFVIERGGARPGGGGSARSDAGTRARPEGDGR